MYQVMASVPSLINFAEIVSTHIKDSTDSPSTLRKFLGRGGGGGGGEDRGEKFLTGTNQQALINASAGKSPSQRKSELALPKDVVGAIDRHVYEVRNLNNKYLADVIYKLSDICQSDLHLLR
jgi:hypothetical protein